MNGALSRSQGELGMALDEQKRHARCRIRNGMFLRSFRPRHARRGEIAFLAGDRTSGTLRSFGGAVVVGAIKRDVVVVRAGEGSSLVRIGYAFARVHSMLKPRPRRRACKAVRWS